MNDEKAKNEQKKPWLSVTTQEGLWNIAATILGVVLSVPATAYIVYQLNINYVNNYGASTSIPPVSATIFVTQPVTPSLSYTNTPHPIATRPASGTSVPCSPPISKKCLASPTPTVVE
jgi:hypothetical protein